MKGFASTCEIDSNWVKILEFGQNHTWARSIALVPMSHEPIILPNATPAATRILTGCGEITDSIIDHLHPDKQSLSACGLTCRTWLRSSRYHLFSRVTLRTDNILSFYKLLECPLNNITPMVRHLTITTFPEISTSEEGVMQILPSLVARLRMVTSLSLHGMTWPLRSHEVLRATLSNLGNVEALELRFVAVYGIHEAVDVLCAFPLLKSISLLNFSCINKLDTLSSAIARQRPSFVIEFISLHNMPPPKFMAWLLSPTPIIHTIQCNPWVGDSDDDAWRSRTLASAEASIREIEISLDFHNSSEWAPVFTLSQWWSLTLYLVCQNPRLYWI